MTAGRSLSPEPTPSDEQVSSVVALFSGGLDSTALVYSLLHDDVTVHGFGVDYGQAHVEELRYAAATAERLDISYAVWPAPAMHGVGAENIYPNRNGVLISLAATYALAVEAQAVAIGCNADDAADYLDCRPAYLDAWQPVLAFHGLTLLHPFTSTWKKDIVATSRQNGWPVEDSRSCYLAGDPCGTCPACTVRAAALA
jgi:7-cyano-7-deazaguanine synthase